MLPGWLRRGSAPRETDTLALHDALPILSNDWNAERYVDELLAADPEDQIAHALRGNLARSEEHTSELQSLRHLVCRLLLETKTRRGRWGLGTSSPCAAPTRSPPPTRWPL